MIGGRADDGPAREERAGRWRALLLLGLAVALIFGASQCAPSLRSTADARAKDAVAARVAYTVDGVKRLLADRTRMAELSADDLRSAFVDDVRGHDWSVVPDDGAGASLYGMAATGGEIIFSVYFAGDGSGSWGLDSAYVRRYGCVQMLGTFGKDSLALRDIDCPAELAGWRGRDALDTSISQVARDHSMDVEIVKGTRKPPSVFWLGGE